MARKKSISKAAKREASRLKKDFRHAVAILKRFGLVSKKTDARSVKPTKHFKKKVREYDAVVKGHAVARKAPKNIIKANKEAGTYKAVGNKLIVPKLPYEKVYVSKKGVLKRNVSEKMVVDSRPTFVKPINFEEWLKVHEPEFEVLRKKHRIGIYYAFTIYGHASYRLMANVDDFIKYLRGYFPDDEDTYRRKMQDRSNPVADRLDNLYIVTMKGTKDANAWLADGNKRRAARNERRRARKREYWKVRDTKRREQEKAAKIEKGEYVRPNYKKQAEELAAKVKELEEQLKQQK